MLESTEAILQIAVCFSMDTKDFASRRQHSINEKPPTIFW
jgi:hypothetical protein